MIGSLLAGIDPAPRRCGPTWREFLTAQAEGIIAADFFHIDTVVRAEKYVRAGQQASACYRSSSGMIAAVLVRFAYLAVSHAFSALWLLRMTEREKDVEILALRHQLAVLHWQLGGQRPRLRPEDRALLAALLVPLARATLRRLRLLVSPDAVLRWHRDLMKRRHARTSVNRGPGRPRTVASIRRLVLRLAAANPSWGYRRLHGELALLGVAIAVSTVWEILKTAGVDLAPQRTTVTWADFLRSQAEAILAMDFIETLTLTGQRQYILAAIHHVGRRVRILGATAHPHPCLGHPGHPQPAHGPGRHRMPRADQISHP